MKKKPGYNIVIPNKCKINVQNAKGLQPRAWLVTYL
jgi:hypothetical protein